MLIGLGNFRKLSLVRYFGGKICILLPSGRREREQVYYCVTQTWQNAFLTGDLALFICSNLKVETLFILSDGIGVMARLPVV